tara:strand:+ start:6057 stop:6200 length:144 start_codon:yes stop_codon:yes gene_type:complete
MQNSLASDEGTFVGLHRKAKARLQHVVFVGYLVTDYETPQAIGRSCR